MDLGFDEWAKAQFLLNWLEKMRAISVLGTVL